MKKTGGIIATIVASLLCGCPALALIIFGVLAAIGIQIPEVTAQSAGSPQDVLLGSGLFLASGLILLLVPIVVGFLTLRKKANQVSRPLPPAAAPMPPVSTTPPPANRQKTNELPTVPTAQPVTPKETSGQVLRDMLLALNRPTAPYQIIGGTAENVDLIAEWKIVDAQWYEIFAKAKLTKVFRIFMKLNAENCELRAQDHEYTVQWAAGVPKLSLAVSAFKGQMTSVEFGAGYAFTETLAPGQVYKYRFSTNEIKKPIQEVAATCGWRYKGVTFGKL